jgi:hypothetical protein
MAKDGRQGAQEGRTRTPRWHPVGILHATTILAYLLLFPSAAQAEIRFSVSPMKIHLGIDPGSRQAKSIEVYNGGDVPLRITTSVSDWTATTNGGMSFAEPGSEGRSAAAWVHLDLGEFSLSPKESRILRLLAELPDSCSGSYWAIVFFEGEAPVGARGMSVTSKARIGSTIYLTANGTEQRNDAITRMEIVPGSKPGAVGLQVGLTNHGNVYYYPAGWIQVVGPGGAPILEQKLPYRVLLPGRETLYRFDWVPTFAGACQFLATFDLQQETLLQGVLDFSVPDTLTRVPETTLGVAPVAEPIAAQGARSP